MKATLNAREVTFEDGDTILEVARREGVFIPTLCEFAALHHRPGTCRMCLVQKQNLHGETRWVTACDTRLESGDVIETRTAEVRERQRLQAELLFMDHCETCSACARHGNCELQTVAQQVGLDTGRMSGVLNTRSGVDRSETGLVFTSDKCIRCLRCQEVCRVLHGIGAITLENVGLDAHIGFDSGAWIDSDRCIQCGQCGLVCPTGALAVKNEVDAVMDALADPQVVTVFQFAPAARIAVSELVGAVPGSNLQGQMVSALKRLGADYVMDTRWAADVTIMEEGTELLERLQAEKAHGDWVHPQTMFTSCCPGWVNHVEKSAPDMTVHLSSTRSPQQIFGALAKTYLPKTLGIDPKRIRQIAIMPCTAKKGEAGKHALQRESNVRDVDVVITVQEFVDLLRRSGIDLLSEPEVPFDQMLMTQTSGAGQLFASTGGVMEAAVRTVAAKTGGPQLGRLPLTPVRGLANTKEAQIETETLGTIRVAVVYGIRSADKMIELVREGRSPYHFVEVMACPGGCIGGGGTARGAAWLKRLATRQATVYQVDKTLAIKSAHENPDVQTLYETFLGEPTHGLAHELLHCTYENRHVDHTPPTAAMLDAAVTLTNHHLRKINRQD